MFDAEALLFVDNDQSKVLEFHVRAHQPMRAVNAVDASALQTLENAFLLAGRAKAADALHDERIFRQALTEGAKMLLGQHRRGHKNRNLFAVIDGFESGADGQLGFAVTHVAANEPVHRPRPLHVPLDLPNRAYLVGSFLKGKSGFKLPLPFGI